jgi:hypothetical protein
LGQQYSMHTVRLWLSWRLLKGTFFADILALAFISTTVSFRSFDDAVSPVTLTLEERRVMCIDSKSVMMWKDNVVAYFKTLYRNLIDVTGEN